VLIANIAGVVLAIAALHLLYVNTARCRHVRPPTWVARCQAMSGFPHVVAASL
jgi:hypothetical protein